MCDLGDRARSYHCDSDGRRGWHYLNYPPDRGAGIVRVKDREHVLAGPRARYCTPLIHAHAVTVAASIDGELGYAPAPVGALVECEQGARKYVAAARSEYEANVVATHGEPAAIGLEHQPRHASRWRATRDRDLLQRAHAAALGRRVLRQVPVKQQRELRRADRTSPPEPGRVLAIVVIGTRYSVAHGDEVGLVTTSPHLARRRGDTTGIGVIRCVDHASVVHHHHVVRCSDRGVRQRPLSVDAAVNLIGHSRGHVVGAGVIHAGVCKAARSYRLRLDGGALDRGTVGTDLQRNDTAQVVF